MLEREALLASLDGRLAAAALGHGSLVAVGGEAGVGKSTLAEAFGRRSRQRAVVLCGACDAMQTARPLGPLHDIARAAGGRLAELVAGEADRHTIFTAFVDALGGSDRPTVVVIEDVHWADEATLDLLVFLGRRVSATRAMVVVTFRDDEVGPRHPLRVVLGNLATAPDVHRLAVPPLSRVAVAELASPHGVDADRLFEITGGNPFFVTELLGALPPTLMVPPSVSDAVLARVARLSFAARAAVDTASVIPERTDVALLRAACDATDDDIDECQRAGVLLADRAGLRFRHELARVAVEQALPAARRAAIHTRVLAYLSGGEGIDADRLAYHAEEAGDADAVFVHAVRAAERAARLGAHREAAAQYARVLRFADRLTHRQRAEILELRAAECRGTNQILEAIEASGEALSLWADVGNEERHGALMASHAWFLWSAGRNTEAYDLASSAVDLLERHPGPGLAAACTYHAYLRMLARDVDGAIETGRRAIALTETYGETGLLARALNAVGSAQWFTEPDQAPTTLERSLAVARESGNDEVAAAALCNLGSGAGEVRLYGTAERWLRETIAWCADRDLDTNHGYASAWLARTRFERGLWSEAGAIASRVAGPETSYVPTRIVALNVLGRVRARRGDPGPGEFLDEAWELATRTGDLQRLWPVAAGRAEAAWLAGNPGAIGDIAGDTFGLAVRLGHAWAIGELGFWLWRAGSSSSPRPDAALTGAAEPYALHMAGRFREAAAAWRALGCPYEAATAAAEVDDVDALTAAHRELCRLGAWPAADALARKLRERGHRKLPGRPRRTTMDNPAGLTEREIEVLRLLSDDLRNNDIAARLHISPKTVDHHVSAILAKLGVATRRDARLAAGPLLRGSREWAHVRPLPGLSHE